jgi:cytochrome c oxidase subunit II
VRPTGAAAFAALAAAGLAGCGAAMMHAPPVGWAVGPERFASNGERLYFTGTSDRGTRMIPYGGHQMGMGGGMMMHGSACAACHGPDRRGGRFAPRFGPVVPPLTPAALTGEHGGEEDGHVHAAYTEAKLARAITQGIGPEGEPLDPFMPRWSISEADLGDLVSYLMDGTPPDH